MQRTDLELVAVASATTPGASSHVRAACAPRGYPPARADLAAPPGTAKNTIQKNSPLPARKTAAEKNSPAILGAGPQKKIAEKKLSDTGARVAWI